MERECVWTVGYPQYDFRLSKMNICALWRCRPMPTTSVLLDMAKSDQNGVFLVAEFGVIVFGALGLSVKRGKNFDNFCILMF